MNSLLVRVIGVCALGLAATSTLAQESTNRVATMTDWNVFTEPQEGNATECWGVSKPKETVNVRDGQPVSVRRGDILLFVTYQPGQPPVISFTGGYPFASGSTVSATIGDVTYQLFTEGEWAWTSGPEDDAKLLAEMKKGESAILKARSGKGTETTDTFSLLGFSAAVDDAAKRCG
jgi:Invasion associated locus B (IalB) protein